MNNSIKKDLSFIELARRSEGNSGALSVLCELTAKSMAAIEKLENLKITGQFIWIGYSDHCNKNIDDFIKLVLDEDEDMLKTIQDYKKKWEEYQKNKEIK